MWWRRISLAVSLVLTLSVLVPGMAPAAQPAHAQQPPNAAQGAEEDAPDGRKMRAGSFLVKFKPSVSDAAKQAAAQAVNATAVQALELPSIVRIDTNPGNVAQTLATLGARSDVEAAHPNYIVRADYNPNDPYFTGGNMYGITKIEAPAAWDVTRSSASVKVAVLDTGIKSDHADLSGKVVLERNFTSSTQGARDIQGHGTHVAGTVAAKTNNGVGVVGVGHDAALMNGKVLDDTGSGSWDWLINALVWAADNGAKVVNMSLGAQGSCWTALQDGVNYAHSRGVVVVAAAGNDGVSTPNVPAVCNNVLAVGSTDANDSKSSFSNYGSWVDVAAPGSSIVSTTNDGSYGYKSGTSMATPHVAGLAALVWSSSHGTSNTAVINRITSQADSPGAGTYWTHGRVNARKAVGTGSTVPGKPTLISPSGTITTNQPQYRWNAVSGASWYQLWVYDSAASGGYRAQWFTSAQTGCDADATCEITPAWPLAAGSHTWYVQGWNAVGYGPWSDGMTFTVATAGPPLAPTPVSPTGTISTNQPTYRWNASAGATYYQLWVYDSAVSSGYRAQWFTSAQSGCDADTTCEVTPAWPLALGSHTWYVQGWNSAGYGPWSSGMTFTVASGPPPAPTLVSPSGTVTTNQPEYRWNASAGATYYQLWVYDSAASGGYRAQWFTAEQTACASGGICRIQPAWPLAIGNHTWYVQGWNSSGYGPWSSGMTFTVAGGGGGFDSQFNGSADGWLARLGTWTVSSAYLETAGAANQLASAYYNNGTFGNYTYEAKVWRNGCDSCATNLIVRGNPATLTADGFWSDSYVFQITRTQQYSIWKASGGSFTPLQSWTASSAIVAGSAWNTLKVVADGSTMSFYINGTLVRTVTDSTFTTGYVGIGMFNDSSTGNYLWADYARLTPSGSGAADNDAKVSAEQQALNEKANRASGGNPNRAPSTEGARALENKAPEGASRAGDGTKLPTGEGRR